MANLILRGSFLMLEAAVSGLTWSVADSQWAMYGSVAAAMLGAFPLAALWADHFLSADVAAE